MTRDFPPSHRRAASRHRQAKAPQSGTRRATGFLQRSGVRSVASEDSAAPAKPRARAQSSTRRTIEASTETESSTKTTPQRVTKLLARAGVASRRAVERMIEEGRITYNGAVLTQPAPLLASTEGLSVDGQPVAKPLSTRLYRFYKPAGCLTTTYDPKGRKTIYDLLSPDLPRLMPVGRLDYSSEGLLLLTNDGEFKRQLELPASGVERTYRARAFGTISQRQLETLAEGLTIDGVHYGRINANLERRTGHNQWIEMTLTEGKNREVRKILEYFGLSVNRLIRTRYGPFDLGDLPVSATASIARDLMFRFRIKLNHRTRH